MRINGGKGVGIMKRIFLGYENLSDIRKDKEVQKKEVNDFVERLVAAGFPKENIKSLSTGVWIEVTGTLLQVQENTYQLVTTKKLCYGEIELAKSERQPISFAGAFVIYSLFPESIQKLPDSMRGDTHSEETRPLVSKLL